MNTQKLSLPLAELRMNVVLAAKSRESEEANLSNSTRKAAKRSNSSTTSMGNGCV